MLQNKILARDLALFKLTVLCNKKNKQNSELNVLNNEKSTVILRNVIF